VSHPRGREASARLLCEPQIVQVTGCSSFFGIDTPLRCDISYSETSICCSHMCYFPTFIFHLFRSAKVHPYKQCEKYWMCHSAECCFSFIQNSWSCPAVFQKWFRPGKKKVMELLHVCNVQWQSLLHDGGYHLAVMVLLKCWHISANLGMEEEIILRSVLFA